MVYIYKKPKRIWLMVGTYLLVAVISIGLLHWGRDEPSLPAFSPRQERDHDTWGRWQQGVNWQRVLEYEFFYSIERFQDHLLRAWLDSTLRWVSGMRLGDVRSLLDVQLPVLAAIPFDQYLPASVGDVMPGSVLLNLPPGSAVVEPPRVEDVPLRVGIYHTHARESFLPELGLDRGADAHTNDMDITVVRIGQELASLLSHTYGIGVVHSTEVHDADGKVGSYIRSENTVKRMLKEYPGLLFLFDVHRDSALRPQTTTTIEGETMARVMILLGTQHDGWRDNYAVAKNFIEIMESLYPGLSIGIYTRQSRYNQHLSSGALLLEIGGVENTMEECLRTAQALAEVIARMVDAMEEG